MANVVLPLAQAVGQAVGGILNKDVKVNSKKTAKQAPLPEHFVGCYDDGAGKVEAVVCMDFPLVASLGAALALIPVGIAKESIQAKKLEGDMRDNAYEVANILANSFAGKRVRLVSFCPMSEASAQVQELIERAKQSACFELGLLPYVGGTMNFHA